MSEAAINRRKSKLFLTNFSPVYDTHNEVIRKKLKPGKFPQTKSGIIKMIAMSVQLGSILTWTVLGQECDNLGLSYSFISSVCIGFVGQLVLMLMFSFGKTVKDPGSWIYGDITFNMSVSFLTIITSILSMKICTKQIVSSVKNLSQILSLCGAGISIGSCAGLFLMYRFIEDPGDETSLPRRAAVQDPRKSIFA